MKKSLFITALALFLGNFTYAQSVTIEPGWVQPKMTTTQRTALGAVADGMLVFDTNTQSYWYRSSGNWVEINGSGSGTPVVPGDLPEVNSKYKAISLPSENVSDSQLKINDNGTICIGYKTTLYFHLILRRNNTFERYQFNRGNSIQFKFEINNLDQILMAYDSTNSGHKRLKYRLYNGASWGAVGTASPDFSSISEFDLCLNTNSKAYLAWNQPDAVTSRVFLSTYNGTSWSHPSTFFNYFNPDWGTPANVHPCSGINIDIAENNEALITWKQTTTVSHAYKAELLSGTWQKPASASSFIEVAPSTYGLTKVESVMALDGSALICFSYYKTEIFDILIDEYYSFNCNIKQSGVWTSNIFLDSYVYFSGSSTYSSYSYQLIPTNSNGVFIYRSLLTEGAGSFNGNRVISKVNSSGLIDYFLNDASSENLSYHFPVSADLNSNSMLQYGLMHEINGVPQVFELYGSIASMTISDNNSQNYLNEYTGTYPSFIISKISENNRTRAISWVQNDGINNRLYMSFID